MCKNKTERMVFYVDVDNLSKEKAEEYMRKLMGEYRKEKEENNEKEI